MKLPLKRVEEWIGSVRIAGAEMLPPKAGQVTGYSIDSRTIAPGDLFFAVKGERFDGHDFVEAALAAGAIAAVVSRHKIDGLPAAIRGENLLVVAEDPLAALHKLAAAVRLHWGKRVVAITGSAGKTTTKEAIAAVLAKKFRVLKTEGNLNNSFGLPLQLLRLERDDEYAVVEMGMSHAGEIAALAKIAAPNWAVVTNVGWAHAENFPEGLSGIARAKYELIEALPPNGVAFLNCGDPYVSQFGRNFTGKTISFGSGPCAEPHAEEIIELGQQGSSFRVFAGKESAPVRISLMGRHNVTNAMAAIAVGLEAGIALAECVAAVESLRAGTKRGQVRQIRGATIIDDCYNSNPEALKSMVATLASIPAGRRILVAGEMLELGRDSSELHRACGEFAAKQGINIVLGVRGKAVHIADGAADAGAQAIFLETPEAAGEWLRSELRPGDAILFKASRGVQLERALAMLDLAMLDKE
ncbi:UDP-N-acetylmuramoylalanyl-D-glutamyl-2,6-diaminopimelate--D-alanyl-D-alanine ligase [Acidisarcina polymorpha]|uniref:UDP-N-acetylmuramoyl-tripeptide--D-alanyl-D-alanine ligase n=1 Tax=Acidisarcina polymorpha TaxID=2211140 RepID=A0A2Z5FVC9_9BACT|nr:UDP-N-acetylmuramoyl-tripeptide--D-alanyl-D-alanine ligase [Acidisarcina polymorpha]AXC10849.1 UDP-N-acetylmuramoylalanyl-D-glutamyl-2,6-diaminopimelate--D-alanyl-D-alanine ligase [Acidisarcina polymorpha]